MGGYEVEETGKELWVTPRLESAANGSPRFFPQGIALVMHSSQSLAEPDHPSSGHFSDMNFMAVGDKSCFLQISFICSCNLGETSRR